MSVLLCLTGCDEQEWAQRFKQHLPNLDIYCWSDPSVPNNTQLLNSLTHLVAWKPVDECLQKLTSLQAVYSLGAGVDHILNCKSLPNVPVYRLVDSDLTNRMSEWVVLQALFHLRQMPAYMQAQSQRQWQPLLQPAATDVTLGIMGMGVLGKAAAKHLTALGFNVLSWSRSAKQIENVKSFSTQQQLPAFLKETEILVNLLPSNKHTHGLVTMELLQQLQSDGPLKAAVYINGGRGATQNEADLYKALTSGILKAASIDVFENEPLAADSPLWQLPNCFIFPHVAATSSPITASKIIASQILSVEAGETAENLVDTTLGY
ncbi:2-hydroxyacid dehydrogenase [Polycladidibacter stylochi]|uniref:2-hydroxyacid dehydrogenase n=1 Tax=Polycladidibacter stylochi TaxID=1807766 RepID=UPI000832C862|nr:glyoxylate/hydroxypyruvate reductase A [Pseudovibrio stylochi]